MYSTGPKVLALTVVFHPDTERIGERAVLWESGAESGEALLGRREMDFRSPRGGPVRPLDDPYLSRRPIRLAAARFGGVRIDCTKTGTRVVANDNWISEERVFLGVEVERGVVLVLSERISILLHSLTGMDGDRAPGFGLVGENPSVERLRREIRDCAGDASPVLVLGEAGTGKKTAARAIHEAGGRDRPYVTLAGADDGPARTCVPDLLAQASGGALLLDAIDRMEVELQNELVRNLARGRNDVRIIATGSQLAPRGPASPLIDKWDWNRLEVPPLQCRRDDVPRLAIHFLREDLGAIDALHRLDDPGPYGSPWCPVRLAAALASYEWPDNVRQLRHVARRLVRDHHTHEQIDVRIDLEELFEESSSSPTSSWGGWSIDHCREGAPPPERRSQLSEIEILSALRAHRWQAEPAAAYLGITPEALFAMMEKVFDKDQRRKPIRRSPAPP